MAQNRTCNLSVTGRPSSPLRHVFKVPPDGLHMLRQLQLSMILRKAELCWLLICHICMRGTEVVQVVPPLYCCSAHSVPSSH
jgi:hypothetical protein